MKYEIPCSVFVRPPQMMKDLKKFRILLNIAISRLISKSVYHLALTISILCVYYPPFTFDLMVVTTVSILSKLFDIVV